MASFSERGRGYACCDLGFNREQYAAQKGSPRESSALQWVGKTTADRLTQSNMLSGELSVQVLRMVAKISGACKVVEIGSYSGYSTIALAEAIEGNLGAAVFAIDSFVDEPESEEIFTEALRKSEAGKIVQLIRKDGLEGLKYLELKTELLGKVDLVFIDADKSQQIDYVKRLIDEKNGLLKKNGGIIVIDNTLWYSKVLLDDEKQDETTKAINQFNTFIAHHPNLESVLLPIRDGISVVRFIAN